MKKKILFLIFLLILISSFKLTFAKDYSIPHVKIEVTLNKDGSASFIEERTFTFDGSFSFGYYDLPKEGYEKLEEFLVYEGETLYKKENSKLSQTYYIEDSGNYYRVNFFYDAFMKQKLLNLFIS
jgi:hypothetical protein